MEYSWSPSSAVWIMDGHHRVDKAMGAGQSHIPALVLRSIIKKQASNTDHLKGE